MEIILDNIIYSKTNNGGVSNYWFELTKYLIENNSDKTWFIEEDKDLLNFHRKQLILSKDRIINNQNIFSIISRVLPILYQKEEKYIYHSSFYRNIIGSKNKIEVTTVHDFIHDYYAPIISKSIHNHLKYNAIKRSNGIICISKSTYSDLKKFCPPKNNQKAEVIYNGVSNDFYPINSFIENENIFLKRYLLDKNYLLYIGVRTNYKNFDFVISAINNNKSLKLVLVGGGNITEKEKRLFNKESIERTKYINNVTNEELNFLYNNALALVYPSSFEGFGIPIIEAMKAGCPVIGYNTPITNEIGGKAVLLLNNLDCKEIDNFKINLNNDDFKRNVVEKGFEEAKKFSWEKCCKETLEFYKNLHD